MQLHDIIVIGTSAGGIEALSKLLRPLKNSIPASIFVVQHLSPTSSNEALRNILQKTTELVCKTAENGERIQKGYVYLASVDNHLMVKNNTILLTRGARENGFRPAIDTLFRSAAANYGPRTIGVILTGMLYDGTIGMEAIKRSGGITIIQDPDGAEFKEMPENVLQHVEVEYILPVTEIAILLNELSHRPVDTNWIIPDDIRIEAGIAERVIQSVEKVEELGERATITCPDCGGSLWQMNHGGIARYRCHTGHSYVGESLLNAKDKQLEETLWVAMRVLEERKNMLSTLAAQHEREGKNRAGNVYHDKIEEAKMHIDRIRNILMTDVSSNPVFQQATQDKDEENSRQAAS